MREAPRLIAVGAYIIALAALLLAIWKRASDADRAESELERRNNRTP